ncbi:MAG: 2,3-bisphosphoglycerate-independent phosphoglycerate mutase [Elusimicrobiota bacterium]
MQKPLLLMILDGWGCSPEKSGNAIAMARKPNFDRCWSSYPHTQLLSCGEAVGLPDGQMGNSEVGHLNIGAGRVVYQIFTKISLAVRNGTFFQNEVLLGAMRNAREKNSALHLMGLISDGGVHSHLEHLYAILELAKKEKVEKVFIHALLDGRDVGPRSALQYLQELEDKIQQLGAGKIATVGGRYWGMDRDNRWERVERAYRCLTKAEGLAAKTAREAIETGYRRGENDEFIQPAVIVDAGGKPVFTLSDNDSFIFFNFRPDRARQITRALTLRDFKEFPREKFPKLYFVSLVQYDETLSLPAAFPPDTVAVKLCLGEYLSKKGLKQLRIAETEKYAHVTYFFNAMEEVSFPGEDRILVNSPKVATYDLKPEMSAKEVTVKLLEALALDKYAVIILNYANPDMVGHTGFIPQTVQAIEVLDNCLGQVVGAVNRRGGLVMITADHGNAEKMLDENGKPFTAHTNDLVPFILVSDRLKERRLRPGGLLGDIAPTILEILGLEKPTEMTGQSLLELATVEIREIRS